MLTYEQPQYAERLAARAPAADPAQGALGLQFWAPAIVLMLVLYVVQHDVKYASSAFAEGELQGDLFAEVGSSSTSRQLGFVTLAALGTALLVRTSPVATTIDGRIVGWLGALVVWSVLSSLWADDIGLSLKRLLPPLFTLVAACGITKTWLPRQLCWFACLLTGTYLLVGLGAELASGAFLYGDDYRFSGTLHPNDQGVNCALLFLAALCLYRHQRGDDATMASRLWLLPMLLGAIFLVLTASRTATLSCAAGLLTFWSMAASGLQKMLLRGGIALVVVLAGVVWLEGGAGSNDAFSSVASMGREQDQGEASSLSGRVPIWREVLGDVAAAPLGGYGYGAFWTPQRVLDYSYVRGWEFTHAHSAYLETLLNVGAIGLALGLMVVLTTRRSALRTFIDQHDAGSRFVAVVLTMALVHGLLDSNFVREGLASTIALLCVATMMFHDERRDAA